MTENNTGIQKKDDSIVKGLLSYAVDLPVLMLLAVTVCHSIFQALQIPVSIWYTMGLCLVIIVLVSIWLINKWTIIAGSIFIILIAIVILLTYKAEGIAEFTVPMFKWMIGYFKGTEKLNESYQLYSLIIYALPIIILFQVFFSKVRFYPAILAIGLAAFIAEYSLGHTEIFQYASVFILGVLLVISRQHYVGILKNDSESTPSKVIWQLSTLPVAILILVTTMLFLPGKEADLKWDFLADTVDKMEDSDWDLFGFTKPRTPFRIVNAGFDYGGESGILGGPVELTNDIMLEVRSPSSQYLRGSILNEYTGKEWLSTIDARRYKWPRRVNDDERITAFDLDENLWKKVTPQTLDKLFTPIEMEITHMALYTSGIFNLPFTNNIDNPARFSYTPYFNEKSETFTSREIESDEPYTITGMVPDLNDVYTVRYLHDFSPSFDWNMNIPEEYSTNEEIYSKYRFIKRNYMNLPASFPERVSDLAVMLTKNEENNLRKVLAIRNYLRENYKYTLKPTIPPVNVDFTEYFLFVEQEGYCIYYASAMVVLSRAAGIPARYIEGFRMPTRADNNGTYLVRGLNAHAWAEIYFPEFGWMALDATPFGESRETAGGGAPISDSIMQEYLDQMENEPVPDDFLLDFDNTPKDTRNQIDPELLAIIIGGSIIFLILTALVTLIAVYMTRIKRWNSNTSHDQLAIYYSEILWLLSLLKLPLEGGRTPYDYAEWVDEKLVAPYILENHSTMKKVARCIVRTAYGNYTLYDEDLDDVAAYYIWLNRYISRRTFWPAHVARWYGRPKKLN